MLRRVAYELHGLNHQMTWKPANAMYFTTSWHLDNPRPAIIGNQSSTVI